MKLILLTQKKILPNLFQLIDPKFLLEEKLGILTRENKKNIHILEVFQKNQINNKKAAQPLKLHNLKIHDPKMQNENNFVKW